MPTLNTKLLLRLLAVTLLLGGGLAVLHTVQAARTPDALLWQANNAAEKGKMDKAIFYMKQYLEFRPDDHETAIKLADLMLDRAVSTKDFINAHFLYERVLREAPERSDVARKLVPLCMRMGRHGDALAHAERLLRETPNDGLLLGQIAECQVAQNHPAEAKKSFEKAIVNAPENVRAYDLYARLLVRSFNQPREARVVLDRMAQANPGQAEAFLVRARFLNNEGNGDECMRDLDRVFLLDPDNGEALVMSAEVLQGRGELRRAREALRDAIATYPKFAYAYRALSWLELLSGNHADARATLERGVAQLPDSPDLLTPLADLWVEHNELDKAAGAIRTLEARKDSQSRINYLRGRILMKQGKWNEALAVLETLRTDSVALPGLAPQLNLLIAGCQERRGDRDAQTEALRRALASDPKHLAARVALANAHLDAGRLGDAIKEYQIAARSPYAGIGVQLTLASLRLRAARGAGSSEEWKSIDESLLKIQAENPHAAEPAVLIAEAFAARGNFAAAEKELRKATAARPGDPRLWSALAMLLARSRGTLAATEALSEGQLATGESLELRLTRARLWADDFQPGREARLATLEELAPLAGDAERARILNTLLELYTATRDVNGQKRTLVAMSGNNSNDLEAKKLLYSLALRGDDAEERSRCREQLAQLDPGGNVARLIEAIQSVPTLSGNVRKLADWQELAKSVIATMPDNADAHLLLAVTAERRGEGVVAAKAFERAASLEPSTIRYQEARLGYYLRSGQDELGRTTVARLEGDPRVPTPRLHAIVDGAIAQGGRGALSKCVDWLSGQVKREPRSAVWLARLLDSERKHTDAMERYKQITTAHPLFADGWSTRLLAATRVGEAEVNDTMAAAEKALGRKDFFAVCAECGGTVRAKLPGWSPPVKNPEDTKAYAKACIAACEARGRLADALPVLTALAENKDTPPADAAWARQTLAVLTASLGTPEQKRQSIAILKDGAKPATIEEARSRVSALTVAFRAVGGGDRRAIVEEMISLSKEIITGGHATSNDWYHLAQLFRVIGDRAGCRKCLVELTKRDPNNLFYLAIRIDELLDEGLLEEAKPLLPRLAEGVADIRVVGAAARFQTLANEPRLALEAVDRYVRTADPGTVDGMARQRQAAELLDQLTRLAAQKGLTESSTLLDGACERYRASLRSYPDAVIPMAALLAFHGQVPLAFEELEKQKAKLSPLALATAGVAVLRSGHAAPREFQIVQGWISEALTAKADSLALKLALAELHALRQDFAVAEQVYREVLAVDPKNLVALNNLAWILAPRADAADEALRMVERAIELYGATGEMLDTRARILISAGKYDRAVADLTDAINQGATPLRFFHLAIAQLRMSKSELAVETFKQARARGLDSKTIHPHDLPTFKLLTDRAGG